MEHNQHKVNVHHVAGRQSVTQDAAEKAAYRTGRADVLKPLIAAARAAVNTVDLAEVAAVAAEIAAKQAARGRRSEQPTAN